LFRSFFFCTAYPAQKNYFCFVLPPFISCAIVRSIICEALKTLNLLRYHLKLLFKLLCSALFSALNGVCANRAKILLRWNGKQLFFNSILTFLCGFFFCESNERIVRALGGRVIRWVYGWSWDEIRWRLLLINERPLVI